MSKMLGKSFICSMFLPSLGALSGSGCVSINTPAHNRHFSLNPTIEFGNDLPLVLLAGPCALESASHALEVSSAIDEIARSRSLPWVYKTSFDKANRSSLSSSRGLGLSSSLEVFSELGSRGISTITDVHESWQCAELSSVVSMLQIPAFLCRQTDLLVAAGETGLLVNVKKGQFLSPLDMAYVAEKLSLSGAGGGITLRARHELWL